jgi:REP element-mobilizing transposase RayT
MSHDSDTEPAQRSRRAFAPQTTLVRPEGGPSPRRSGPFRHLAHVPSFPDNPLVFFTTCTYQRRKILAAPEYERILREIWQCSADHDGWWTGNYILMPDHLHLFARPEIGARRIAGWVQMWKSVSSRRIAAALSIKTPIWQAAYFDRYLRSSENYTEKWHYVEQNAVRAGLVATVEEWPYRGTINDLMF